MIAITNWTGKTHPTDPPHPKHWQKQIRFIESNSTEIKVVVERVLTQKENFHRLFHWFWKCHSDFAWSPLQLSSCEKQIYQVIPEFSNQSEYAVVCIKLSKSRLFWGMSNKIKEQQNKWATINEQQTERRCVVMRTHAMGRSFLNFIRLAWTLTLKAWELCLIKTQARENGRAFRVLSRARVIIGW